MIASSFPVQTKCACFAGSAKKEPGFNISPFFSNFSPIPFPWKDSPDMPKGGHVAFLVGDPTKAEVVVLRVKLPANYQVPPHTR